MSRASVRPRGPLRGRFSAPGDKSITQRAILLAALAEGETRILGANDGADARAALGIVRALGIPVRATPELWTLRGGAMRESERVLDARNSGTALRLSLGLLAAMPFFSVVTGDASLRRRPVARVIEPLRLFGADLAARAQDRLPPVAIRGRDLHGAEVLTPVASAQVKSAILLAAIQAEGASVIRESVATRDHTERMLPSFGVAVERDGTSVRVAGRARPRGAEIRVPGDLSAAAFFLAAGALVPRSDLWIGSVGINSTRRAFLDLLARSGARIEIENERVFGGEPVADLRVRPGGRLLPFQVGRDEATRLIDELPLVAVLAAFAEGSSALRGAGELRVKESDRIAAVTAGLRAIGVEVEEHEDGWTIQGKGTVRGGRVEAMGDHRIAMAFLIAGLRAEQGVVVDGSEAIGVSDPGFLARLRAAVR